MTNSPRPTDDPNPTLRFRPSTTAIQRPHHRLPKLFPCTSNFPPNIAAINFARMTYILCSTSLTCYSPQSQNTLPRSLKQHYRKSQRPRPAQSVDRVRATLHSVTPKAPHQLTCDGSWTLRLQLHASNAAPQLATRVAPVQFSPTDKPAVLQAGGLTRPHPAQARR